MKKISLVHFADLHLDMPFSSLSSHAKIPYRRRQDLLDVFDKIIDVVNEKKADLLLICGDLFEHGYVRKSTINLIKKRFESLSNTDVVILPGNHDPYGTGTYYKDTQWSSNVHILSSSNGILKVGHSMIYALFPEDTLTKLPLIKQQSSNQDINILMTHTSLDINTSNNQYNPLTSEALSHSGMDYIATGHFHNVYFEYGPNKNIYNPGSPEPLGFDEQGEHYIFEGDIYKDEIKCTREINKVNVSIRHYKSVDVNINGSSLTEDAYKCMINSLTAYDNENGLFNFRLSGSLERDSDIDSDRLVDMINKHVYYAKIRSIDAYFIDEECYREGLPAEYKKIIQKKLDNAETKREQDVLKKALKYGLEAIINGELNL